MTEAQEEIPSLTEIESEILPEEEIPSLTEIESEILPDEHAASSPDVDFTMAEAEEEVHSVENEATILPVGHADITPDEELVSNLHVAQAREKSSKLMWNLEVWGNQRAAELCGGRDYSYAGRVREQRLEGKYKENLAHRQKCEELLVGQ